MSQRLPECSYFDLLAELENDHSPPPAAVALVAPTESEDELLKEIVAGCPRIAAREPSRDEEEWHRSMCFSSQETSGATSSTSVDHSAVVATIDADAVADANVAGPKPDAISDAPVADARVAAAYSDAISDAPAAASIAPVAVAASAAASDDPSPYL